MDQHWASPSFAPGITEEGSCVASMSLSSLSQHPAAVSTTLLISPLAIINREIPAEDGARLEKDGGGSLNSTKEDQTAAQKNYSTRQEFERLPHKPRKGHRKSRQGCYNCKRRKVKCQETQPECENCSRKKIKCNYPAPKTLSELQVSAYYSPRPITSLPLQATPTQFTLTDMRLFHHFLTTAYPHLPVGNDSSWLFQVPLIAHHNEYLMHAILGLAASHLELITGIDLRSTAIHHRVLAIKGSNAAISQPHRSGSDADALLAACYALTFQSAYMSDGLPEFFQMVRGCSLLSSQLKSENVPIAFFLTEKDHFEYMEDKLLDLPVISKELVDGGERSLIALPPLFNQSSHSHFYQLLLEVIEALKVGSLGAYFKFVMVYQGILKMESQVFHEFINPSNLVARLLIAHFLAIQIVVSPIVDREYAGRAHTRPARGHLDWLSILYKNCPIELKKYLKWPMAVKDYVRDEIEGKEKIAPKISILNEEGLNRPF